MACLARALPDARRRPFATTTGINLITIANKFFFTCFENHRRQTADNAPTAAHTGVVGLLLERTTTTM